MQHCPRCGTANPPESQACSACGMTLGQKSGGSGTPKPTMLGMPATDPAHLGPAASGQVPVHDGPPAGIAPGDLGKTAVGYTTPHTLKSEGAAAAPSGGPGFKQTMLGVAPGDPSQPQAKPAGGFKHTMLGMASPGAHSPEGAPKGNLKQTMLGGMGAKPAAPAEAGAPAGTGFKQTMLGGVAGQGGPPAPAAGAGFKQTMLGGVAPGAQGSPPATEPSGGHKQTMLGMAPAGSAQVPPPGAQANPSFAGTHAQFDTGQSPQQPQQPANLAGTQVQFDAGQVQAATPAANPSLAGTQMQFGGGAAPAIPTVSHDPKATQVQFDASAPLSGGDRPSTGTLAIEPQPGAASPGTPSPGAVAPGTKSEKKTVLGVAVPGVAPINPGLAKPSSAPPPDAAAFVPEPVPAPPRSGKFVALVLLLGLIAVGAIVAAVLYVLQKPDSITARVTADAQGDEQLELNCKECPEGTVAKLDARQATFKGGKAQLPLSRPLKIGENPVTVSVTKPGKTAETFPLTVPVQFRVKGDLTSIDKNPPIVAVLVEAIPGTAAVVDGKALTLDEEGKGRYEVDISESVSGESATVQPLEKRVPYTLTPPEAEPVKGEITLKTGIAALIVDAPGPSIVIDKANFMLAGNTQRGGSVAVAGRPITVDPEGRFAQLMSVSSVGETTISIRASAEKHAPRLVPIRIRRVDSLKAEAKRLRSSARTSFADFGQDPDKSKGSEVLVEAKVIESRADRHTTVALIEVTTGCPSDSCLARVVYGAKTTLKRDQKVTIAGTVQGAVEGPRTGSRVPEIRADFVVDL